MKGICIVSIYHTKGSPGCFTMTLTTIKQHTHVCKCTHRQTCTHIWNTQTHENWRRGVEMAVKKHCLEIAVEQVVLWTDLKEEEELECLRRQTVQNRCANIRKWSFSKCFCVYTRGQMRIMLLRFRVKDTGTLLKDVHLCRVALFLSIPKNLTVYCWESFLQVPQVIFRQSLREDKWKYSFVTCVSIFFPGQSWTEIKLARSVQ